MTKKELVYLLLTRANGEDVSPDRVGKYHKKEVERYLDMAYSDVIRQAYQNAFRYRDYGQLDSLTKAYYNVAVEYDPNRCEYYSDLPVSVVQLPNNAGIRLISPQCDQTSTIKYSINGSSSFMNKLEVRRVNRSKRYYVEGERVYYINADNKMVDVLMKVIPDFKEFEDDDEVPIIAGLDMAVFDNALQRLVNENPSDDYNDNSSKIAGNG